MFHKSKVKNVLLGALNSRTDFHHIKQAKSSIKFFTVCKGCQKEAGVFRHTHVGNSRLFMKEVTVSRFKFYATSSASGDDKAGVKETTSDTSTESKPSKAGAIKEAIMKVVPKRKEKKKIDLDKSYTANIYITPVRAMQEYLLTPKDLEACQRIIRRSPYDTEQKMMVYLRQDVERRAIDIWGSLENLTKEKSKKKRSEDRYITLDIFHLAKQDSTGKENPFIFDPKQAQTKETKEESIFKTGSGRVVLYAVVINAFNFAIKLVAWMYTGSHSMFAEAIHSLADTCNQLILAYGLSASIKKADSLHPYGYMNIRYVSSLISGVGIFCFGTGLSWYHGIQGILYPQQLESLHWAMAILGGAFISESATLAVAANQIRESAAKAKMNFWEYVRQGYDPSVNVVLLEDMAAVGGIGIAGICMGVTHFTGSPFADALGSMLIGCVLGGVASFIIHTNTTALVGRSIASKRQQEMRNELESDRMIRALHDIKATDMGGKHVRFKAEVDFDGREITRSYLYNQDVETILKQVQSFTTVEEVENFLLEHGENVIDMLGGEVDRIERNLKKRHPELRHVDLEVL